MAELQRLSDEVVAKIRPVPGAVDVDSTLETRPAGDGRRASIASWRPTSASTSAASRCSCAAWSRASCRRKLREGDKEYDIRVRLAPEFRNDFEAIARTPLYSPTRRGRCAPRDIVAMEPGVGPTNIEREQRRRQAKIDIELVGPRRSAT